MSIMPIVDFIRVLQSVTSEAHLMFDDVVLL
jgi:hypothetical protein